MNHSCAPNAWHEDGGVFALVDIPAGEEVTYDYGMSEADALPWACGCGHASCRSVVGGAPSLIYERYQGRCLRHIRQAALSQLHGVAQRSASVLRRLDPLA
ncbi:MAG: hypothetical protein RL685_6602 [Pseudomonadota bacterium]|jgi:hypothetical protein